MATKLPASDHPHPGHNLDYHSEATYGICCRQSAQTPALSCSHQNSLLSNNISDKDVFSYCSPVLGLCENPVHRTQILLVSGKNFGRYGLVPQGWVWLPINLSLVQTCCGAKFGGSAATSPLVELLTKNFAPLRGPLPTRVGEPKFNHFYTVGHKNVSLYFGL